jgi:hypothetical protein
VVAHPHPYFLDHTRKRSTFFDPRLFGEEFGLSPSNTETGANSDDAVASRSTAVDGLYDGLPVSGSDPGAKQPSGATEMDGLYGGFPPGGFNVGGRPAAKQASSAPPPIESFYGKVSVDDLPLRSKAGPPLFRERPDTEANAASPPIDNFYGKVSIEDLPPRSGATTSTPQQAATPHAASTGEMDDLYGAVIFPKSDQPRNSKTEATTAATPPADSGPPMDNLYGYTYFQPGVPHQDPPAPVVVAGVVAPTPPPIEQHYPGKIGTLPKKQGDAPGAGSQAMDNLYGEIIYPKSIFEDRS